MNVTLKMRKIVNKIWNILCTYKTKSNSFIYLSSVLSKLITSLNDAETLSGESDLLFLRTLLQSKELNALVTVHGKVAKIGKDDRLAPVLSDSMQVRILYEMFFFSGKINFFPYSIKGGFRSTWTTSTSLSYLTVM